MRLRLAEAQYAEAEAWEGVNSGRATGIIERACGSPGPATWSPTSREGASSIARD